MRLSDLVIGILLLLGGGMLCLGARGYPNLPNQAYGAATFPFVIGLALLLLGAIFCVGAVLRGQVSRPVTLTDWGLSGPSWLRLGFVLALVAGYVAFSPLLGFRITAGIMLLGLLLTFRTRPVVALPVTAVAVLGIEQVFGGLLRVPLPYGTLIQGG